MDSNIKDEIKYLEKYYTGGIVDEFLNPERNVNQIINDVKHKENEAQKLGYEWTNNLLQDFCKSSFRSLDDFVKYRAVKNMEDTNEKSN